MTLWEGARRLPYFFAFGVGAARYVYCPQCALEHVQDVSLIPHYTTIRSVMCCRCGILIGPINEEEMVEA